MRSLLEAGGDTKKADSLGHTPLSHAVLGRRVECVRALLPVSDLLQTDLSGYKAFHVAVNTASEECFELLLPLMDVDLRTVPGFDAMGKALNIFHQTPLHLACLKGQMAMARALLDRGADRIALDSTPLSPLHCAASEGALACVVLLVGRPEKPRLSPEQVNAQNEDLCTALHLAACGGHEKVCGVLIAMGASLNAEDANSDTALMLAQRVHPHKTSLHELLSGRGPANLPGTVCDHCGKPAGRKMVVCSACEIVRYCDAACQLAAWEGHEAECKVEKARREASTALRSIESGSVVGGGASAA